MKFEVTKTNYDTPDGKPCKEAVMSEEQGGWFQIEINSLDELIKFLEEHNSVVIERSLWNPKFWKIEIYNDYRE